MGSKSKGKTDKSSKKSKKEPIKGNEAFCFSNGDKYVGDFIAYPDKTIFKHGDGIYTTWDGQIYEGEWEMDKLKESKPITLTFADDTVYRGHLIKQKFDHHATVTFPDQSQLSCTFNKNQPSGKLLFTDPNKNTWRGNAEDDFSLLFPNNHFYYNYPIDVIESKSKSWISNAGSTKASQKIKSVKKSTSSIRKRRETASIAKDI